MEKNNVGVTKNRNFCLLVFGVIYGVAVLGAGLLMTVLPFALAVNLLIADVAATAFVYLCSFLLGNSSVYDPYWSVAPLVIAFGIAIVRGFIFLPQILLMVAILIWGIRLTANWMMGFENFDKQDWRYDHYKAKSGKWWQAVNFFGIHLFPTLVVYLCMLPAVLLLTTNTGEVFNLFTVASFSICFVGFEFELVADYQMHMFRFDKSDGILTSGLWKLCRHPNYFGEIVFWWGIYLLCVTAAPALWWTAIGAIVCTLMFIFVSIPLAEGRYMSREGYAEYCKRTSMLIPLPPKKD